MINKASLPIFAVAAIVCIGLCYYGINLALILFAAAVALITAIAKPIASHIQKDLLESSVVREKLDNPDVKQHSEHKLPI
ncbi:hypothetical protein [Wolbachia endosymbiont of Pentidionis agamae]|uniref:hypothetical protein n=1 Tax=Wolbachia endosymbiont of Pentidionis agamae TaxID=3110435 RepID=UPI002FD7929D